MSLPITATVFWTDRLYGTALSEWINHQFEADPDLVAPVRSLYNRKVSTDTIRYYDRDGQHCLRLKDGTVRLARSNANMPKDRDQHPYRHCVWQGDDEGLAYRILLHPRVAVVVPGRSKLRQSRKTMSLDTLFIMRKPMSAHSKLNLIPSLKALEHSAPALLNYTWQHGIVLRDPDDILPRTFLKGTAQ
jgi:hypothetical protein